MSKYKVKLNREGVRSLLKSEEMQTVLNKKAAEIRNRCGDGYEQDSRVGVNRANAMIFANTHKAKKDNLNNNTLLKALK